MIILKINFMWILVIAIVCLSLLAFTIMLSKRKITQISPPHSLSFDIQELISALGGKGNINSCEANVSKLKVSLKNTSLLKPKIIKNLGATGIIKTSTSVTIIFGKSSEYIAKALSLH